MSGSEIKVLVVDNHILVREALCEWLRREEGLAVVGTAAAADAAIARAVECRPDVILMDIDMPGMSCFDAGQRITALRPDIRIVYLSAFVTDRLIDQALQAKAGGYLTTSDPPETLIRAIREVVSGGAYFSEKVRSRIVNGARGPKLAREPRSRASTVTCRELQILEYLARGLAKKQIARILSISVKTVDRHAVNLMAKLDIHDRVELARFAIREGLVGPDGPGAVDMPTSRGDGQPTAARREQSGRFDHQPQVCGQTGAQAANGE